LAPKNPVVSRGFGRGPWRSRTGDCGFRARKTPQPVFVSVAKLAGSDSLSIRPREGRAVSRVWTDWGDDLREGSGFREEKVT
jgi:hypothetical protein